MSLSQDLIDKLNIVRALSNGKYKTSLGNQLTQNQILEVIDPNCLKGELYKEFRTRKTVFAMRLFTKINNILAVKNHIEVPQTEIPDSTLDLANYFPVTDVESGQKLLINRENKTVSKIDVSVWENNLSKEERAIFAKENALAKFVYDPYNLETLILIPFENTEVLKINLYDPPEWRKLDMSTEDIKSLKCPEIIAEFLAHLFPDKTCREFVINWMHYALVGRCETYLVLNGKKGAGKGFFCEQILEMLVGKENFIIAPESLLESYFNGALDKRRILVMDEIKVDSKSKLNKLKRYINKTQTIEKKGIDADKLSEIYSSAVINNNDLEDLFLTWDERRFSVPEITETPYIDVKSQEEINKFVEILRNDKILQRDFGFWILYHGKDEKDRWHEFSTWKGDHFFRIVYNSLSLWKKLIVDKIISKEKDEYEIRELKREYKIITGGDSKLFPNSRQRIKDFLDNYRHEGKYYLGTLEGKGNELRIIPNNVFRREDIIENAASNVESMDFL